MHVLAGLGWAGLGCVRLFILLYKDETVLPSAQSNAALTFEIGGKYLVSTIDFHMGF